MLDNWLVKDIVGPIFLIGIGIVLLVLLTSVFWKWKVRRLLKDRVGSVDSFIESFDGSGIDVEVLKCIYGALSKLNSNRSVEFPILANDDIEDVYGIVGEDLEDYIDEILKKTGRSWDNYDENPYRARVITVKDLALFVNAQPTKPDL